MDWKKKLTSRKFWVAVANFVGMLLIAMGKGSNVEAQVTALIMAGAGVVAYIVGEGLVDSTRDDVIDAVDDKDETVG